MTEVDLSFGCDKEIAKAIHYPECWDDVAYPTLASALWEMLDVHNFKYPCQVCGKKQGRQNDFIYALDPVIKKRVVHVMRDDKAVSMVTGHKFKVKQKDMKRLGLKPVTKLRGVK